MNYARASKILIGWASLFLPLCVTGCSSQRVTPQPIPIEVPVEVVRLTVPTIPPQYLKSCEVRPLKLETNEHLGQAYRDAVAALNRCNDQVRAVRDFMRQQRDSL